MPETNASSPPLFDVAFQRKAQDRARRNASGELMPLEEEARASLLDRLADVKERFHAFCDYAPRSAALQNQLAALYGIVPASKPPYNLLTSCLTLHEANDLPATLAELFDALSPGGLFLGVLLGGESLTELRACLMEAEHALTGGVSPRVAPMLDLETASRLLPQAGFALPVADHERLVFLYPDLFALMRELRAMGCTNSLTERSRRFAPRRLFEEAARLYAERFPGPKGGITATFDLIFLHGWREN